MMTEALALDRCLGICQMKKRSKNILSRWISERKTQIFEGLRYLKDSATCDTAAGEVRGDTRRLLYMQSSLSFILFPVSVRE